MQINKYDKLLRQQYLATPMPPLRLTRLSLRDLAQHTKYVRAIYRNNPLMSGPAKRVAIEQCWSRFFRQFSWN